MSGNERVGGRTEHEHRGGPAAGVRPGRRAPAEVDRACDGAVGAGQEKGVGVHFAAPAPARRSCELVCGGHWITGAGRG
jgi:hypothetical protein